MKMAAFMLFWLWLLSLHPGNGKVAPWTADSEDLFDEEE